MRERITWCAVGWQGNDVTTSEQPQGGSSPPATHLACDEGVQAYTEPYPRFAPDGSNRAAFIPARAVVHVAAVNGPWAQVIVDGADAGWVSGSQLIPPIGQLSPASTPRSPFIAAPGSMPAPQYVVMAPRPVGNGFAIAALTLGIVGAVLALTSPFGSLLGIVCGLLGLIFGFVGLGNVNRHGAGNGGLALAGIILGSLALVISGYTTWNFYRLAHAIQHSISAQASVPVVNAQTAVNQVHVTNCSRFGTAQYPGATGTLVNTASKRQSFRVTIAFHAGRSVQGYGTGTTGPVDPGQRSNWFVGDPGASFAPSACTIVATP
jgi:hypothetical protein